MSDDELKIETLKSMVCREFGRHDLCDRSIYPCGCECHNEQKEDDYEPKRAWNTFSFEFKKIVEEMQAKTEELFIKIFKAKIP